MNRYVPDGWILTSASDCAIFYRAVDHSIAWCISNQSRGWGGAPSSPSDRCFLGLFIDDSICIEWQCISVLQAIEIANSAKIPS